MENIDDSGIDSDARSTMNGNETESGKQPLTTVSDNEVRVEIKSGANTTISSTTSGNTAAVRKPSDLQKKLERQREAVIKKLAVDQQPKKKNMPQRNRLIVPNSKASIGISTPDERQLLVAIDTDESEDEFATALSKATQREITEQLIKDGYNLDLESDNEDLDLIPPRPVSDRCVCCNPQFQSCTIQ
ncbi:unnamed protein product [Owenia fusiformis]|uniref:Protein FAM219A n=1 Tax=Owenia fusiformis TaxID=6347 RepID=A0A8S4PTN3_OWEFU|nr:unnamed protein product [Owenia fusiformis]